jgi:hypothetical protein
VIDLLGKVIAGRSGSYKRWFGRGVDSLEGLYNDMTMGIESWERTSLGARCVAVLRTAVGTWEMEERHERLISYFLHCSH